MKASEKCLILTTLIGLALIAWKMDTQDRQIALLRGEVSAIHSQVNDVSAGRSLASSDPCVQIDGRWEITDKIVPCGREK